MDRTYADQPPPAAQYNPYLPPVPQQPLPYPPSLLPAPRRGVPAAWVVVIAAIAAVIGLLVGILGTALVTELHGSGASSDAAPASERLPEQLPELMAFVESSTGGRFESTPSVDFLSGDAFVDALLEPTAAEPQASQHDDFDTTMAALGLVGDADAFAQDEGTAFTEGVVGFYDPSADRLVVRGADWTPFVETTVVHELVHALQDQLVDLDAATRRTKVEDESYVALSAVAEGQATVVEYDWINSQGPDYEQRYFSSEELDGSAAMPDEPLVSVLAALPYDLGFEAVSSLQGHAGPEAVLDILRTPPTTLEQVWDLGRWRDGDAALTAPVPVPDPQVPDGAQVVDRGSLGAHLLTLLTLEDSEDWYWLEDGPVTGWAGDRYSTWRTAGDDEQICTRVDVALDDGDARAALQERLTRWDGTVADGPGGALRLERCQAG